MRNSPVETRVPILDVCWWCTLAPGMLALRERALRSRSLKTLNPGEVIYERLEGWMKEA